MMLILYPLVMTVMDACVEGNANNVDDLSNSLTYIQQIVNVELLQMPLLQLRL